MAGDTMRDVQKALAEYSYIKFTALDINGVNRGCILPAASAARFLESGAGIYSGAQAYGPGNELIFPKEVVDAKLGNASIIPDLDTLHVVNWLPKPELKVGQFLCGTYWDKSTPQEACSRSILKRLLANLDDAGYRAYMGAELEYVLLDAQNMEPVFSKPDHFAVLTQSNFHEWIVDVDQSVSAAGVTLERMHCEYSPGQFEFITAPKFGIAAMDGLVILKQAIKEMAAQRGMLANFMAKRSLESLGSGLHLSLSLWDKHSDVNLLWDESGQDKLSKVARHWIAGILHHANALAAICSPTTNCYSRLHTAFAPHRANWGLQNRNVMIRAKNDGPQGTFLENRLSSGLANPYLAIAATIAAGLDGIKWELTCPDPHDEEAAPELPHSLSEALEALQKDEVMVEALGKTFIEWFVMSKTEVELKAVVGVTDEAKRFEIQCQTYSRLM